MTKVTSMAGELKEDKKASSKIGTSSKATQTDAPPSFWFGLQKSCNTPSGLYGLLDQERPGPSSPAFASGVCRGDAFLGVYEMQRVLTSLFHHTYGKQAC